MDYTTIINYASILMAILFGLVFATTIIVEVFKSLFVKLPTNILAVIVSVVVTMLALFIWAVIASVEVLWYYIAADLILGLFVAYASMFGFDKFKEAYEKLKQMKK